MRLMSDAFMIFSGLLILLLAGSLFSLEKFNYSDNIDIEKEGFAVEKIAEGIRVFAADMLWLKVDQYHHSFKGSWHKNRDVIPLIRLITLLNPHMVEAYVTGAHHLIFNLEQVNQGLEFLQEGILENSSEPVNPSVHKLFGELAFYKLRHKEDVKEILTLLEKAMEFAAIDNELEEGEFLNPANYFRLYRLTLNEYESVDKLYSQKRLAAAKRFFSENFPDSNNVLEESVKNNSSLEKTELSWQLAREEHEHIHTHESEISHSDHEHDSEACHMCGHHHPELGSMHSASPFPWNRNVWPEVDGIQAVGWLLLGISFTIVKRHQ